MASPPSDLAGLVREELTAPVDPRVAAMAEAIAARYGAAVQAVLFYGSCLREAALDGLMLDFYVIVSDYRAAYGRGWLAFANRTVPPNVFQFAHGGLSAKYAVMSQADFVRSCGPEAGDVSVWARFAQPSRLAWARDAAVVETMAEAVARCAPTLFSKTAPMLQAREVADELAIWRRGFELTYSCEVRAERDGRAEAIVATDPARYRRFGAAIARQSDPAAPAAAQQEWRRLRRRGKLLTVARVVKAGTTFTGGVDYLVWKINRHADAAIEVKPWHRRWPVIFAVSLLPRLLRQGALR